MNRVRRSWGLALRAVLLVGGGLVAGAREVSVDGLGLLSDLRVEGFLEELATPGDIFTPAFVEEGFFILNGRLQSEGYLRPRLQAEVELADGTTRTLTWEGPGQRPLEEGVAIETVRYEVEKGLRFYFEELDLQGLNVLERDAATAYFWADNFLFSGRQARLFSPRRLRQGRASLQAELRSMGYREATVEPVETRIDESTGAVEVDVRVDEGRRTLVTAVEERLAERVEKLDAEARLETRPVDREPLHDGLLQEAATNLRTRLFNLGYPDAAVRTEVEEVDPSEGNDRLVRVLAIAEPGPRQRVAAVEFRGNDFTSTRFLERKADLEPGSWLDRVAVEEARNRLARLGVFSDLRTELVPREEEPAREIIFHLEEGVRQEASMLVGWGSYEQLRGGLEFRHHNLWGRAHKVIAQGLLSLKSAEVAVRYRIPELYNFPASAQGSARFLRRDEVSFVRQEWYVETGLDWRRRDWDSLFGVTYRLELLRAREIATDALDVPEEARAASIYLEHRYDGRDALLDPEAGFLADTELELADPIWGSEVTYQRFDTQWAWHHRLSDSLSLHVGLRHRVLISWGAKGEELPLNKRFFPGGENSIRGYTEGEASPRDAEGIEIGAEVASLANVELEIALTRNLDFVLFSDHLYQSVTVDAYPGDTDLHSVGVGLRYNTPLGPLRLEYGYNLNPRPRDPNGALHFSLGYPF